MAAVICTVAIGEGAALRVQQATASIGVNFVWIEAGSVNSAGVRTGAFPPLKEASGHRPPHRPRGEFSVEIDRR